MASLAGNRRVRRTVGLLALAAAASTAGARADATATAPSVSSALLAIVDADPLGLARVVQRFGDDAVLALLAPDRPTEVRIAAVRASPWLREPERALVQLGELAGSRDSELAPSAARAALQISRALDAASLARREVRAEDLAPALSALHRTAERAATRADLRAMVATAAAQLEAALVSAPPGR